MDKIEEQERSRKRTMDSSVVGCGFHLSQAWDRKRDALGLRRYIQRQKRHDRIVKWWQAIIGDNPKNARAVRQVHQEKKENITEKMAHQHTDTTFGDQSLRGAAMDADTLRAIMDARMANQQNMLRAIIEDKSKEEF
ncbi:hypothetical protein TELCIR_04329 [Teladorsagia circumcincta]|uniref:Uncharacterized protein n=1 Tax=Teladorsagia circumcincta TaxID=45464 RepID=A0A2G9UTV4_TELCI|nr:hypothetical protein TELCIR_04329 [Teladorsagia circumcincta]